MLHLSYKSYLYCDLFSEETRAEIHIFSSFFFHLLCQTKKVPQSIVNDVDGKPEPIDLDGELGRIDYDMQEAIELSKTTESYKDENGTTILASEENVKSNGEVIIYGENGDPIYVEPEVPKRTLRSASKPFKFKPYFYHYYK